MPIPVTCRCGQKINVPEQYAGKAVKCPKCAQPIKVPAAPSPAAAAKAPAQNPAATKKTPAAAPDPGHSDLFDEIGLKQRGEGLECPSCGFLLPHEAVLCINCGYNFKLKRRLQTLGTTAPVKPVEEAQTPPKKISEIEKMLIRAEDELEHEPVEQERGYGSRWGAWILMLVMILVTTGVIGGLVAFFQYTEGQKKKEEESKAMGAPRHISRSL